MLQQNKMPSLYCTALGFTSKNEEYKQKTTYKLIKFESNFNNEKCV